MLHFLTIGTVLGLSAGLAPGPLLTLVISETLRHDIKAGMKVALAPVITDLPIVVLALFLVSKLSHFHGILGIISLAGGMLVFFLGYQRIRTKSVEMDLKEIASRSFTKGVLANALSPHPYLFWFSVGAPTMTRAMDHNISAAVGFPVSFYVFLVGSKIVLAILVGRSRSLFSSGAYLFTMRFLGFVLCGFAVVLFHDGLSLLRII